MASDLISREALFDAMREKEWQNWPPLDEIDAVISNVPTVDAIPIDTVAEMLADLFGDCCPCNYNDLDEVLSIGCERKNCPGFFECDYSCWKKYVEWWMKIKMDGKDTNVPTKAMDGGKQDAQETTL